MPQRIFCGMDVMSNLPEVRRTALAIGKKGGARQESCKSRC